MKSISWILILVQLTLPMVMMQGCSNEESTATQPPDNPGLTPEVQAQLDQAEQYEYWIGLMEPFVQPLADGTYQLGWERFLESIRSSHPAVVAFYAGAGKTDADTELVSRLRQSLDEGNRRILEAAKNGTVDELMGSACWNYWWGRRCCFWGREAIGIMIAVNAGTSVPVYGWTLIPYAVAISWNVAVYNGFCLNSSWAWPSGFWITRP